MYLYIYIYSTHIYINHKQLLKTNVYLGNSRWIQLYVNHTLSSRGHNCNRVISFIHKMGEFLFEY